MGEFINFLQSNLADFWTYTGFYNATYQHFIMIAVGIFFIYLAVAKEFEPMLLIPIGFGMLIGNIPFNMEAGLQVGIYEQGSVLNILYQGVTSGWYPPLIFLGIGAMTDFSALISNPKLMLIGAAAQFGIFGAYMIALEWGFDPSKRMTVGNILLMTLVWQVCTAGSDQMAIQRYLSTPDVATAKRSYRISLVTSCTIQLLLAVVGLVVMTYFLRYPQMLAPGTTVAGDADTLFPRFILIGLPAGITGLIAAGIMSAAMSSLSSGLNSSATVIYEDIINRNRKESNTSLKSLRHIKLIAVALGVVVALSSFLVAYVSGNLLDVVIKVVNLVVAPLFVLFFMALFVPWATSRGTVTGGLFSMLVAVLIAFAEIFGITALWIMPVALVSGVVASMLFSWFDRWLVRRGFLEEKSDRQNK